MVRAFLFLSVFWLTLASPEVARSAEDSIASVSDSEDREIGGAGIDAEATRTGFQTRIWRAIGFLHPAIAHFPIVLFSLGAVFVVLSWKWPALGTQIPLCCMLIGASLAIPTAVMGWSLAPEQGYGAQWSLTDWDREINVHRISGSIVASISSIFAIVALAALWRDSDRLQVAWKTGLIICALMAGLVGHQGGELKYGDDFLSRAFRILSGHDEPPASFPNAVDPID